MNYYDVVVIGSGPGGYISAIRCSQLGFNTAIIEKYKDFGGTCLNVGCIPSKTLLSSAENYHKAKNMFYNHGIQFDNLLLDITKMMNRKKNIINKICEGIKYLFIKYNIKTYLGTAIFKDKNTISILDSDSNIIKFTYAIIATGSKPMELPFAKIDGNKIISSTNILSLNYIPKKLSIIGGGVIGIELGSLYNKIGSDVTIIEYEKNIISNLDLDLSKELENILKKNGIKFYLSTKVESIDLIKDNVKINAKINKNDDINIICDCCLLSIGRIPYTNNLGLENIGIKKDKKGFILVNNNLQTNIENIYAIGDVIGGLMLAHKAEKEGIFVSDKIYGNKNIINYNLIPSVIYTNPEVASVGKSEKELKDFNIKYKIGKFPIKALGRAISSGEINGFIKILSDELTDEILGIHMIGPRVSDIIIEAVLAMEFKASSEDLSLISYAHPTFTEAVKEAALIATGNKPIHV
ncbi:Dihydrolipoamide dehydrogenase of 2-oxoglutarate dehydrogenase [Candidatus Karelsulcia muelleri]|uniref:Dihydrolipoyl dehydrogenase n=1 Tax=Candidatus Karelsulcia muelleri TaxID=336810 RepID=A0A654M2I0_9FLAO|nr:dihydrolipoyl dehydrogenase [Candidatus Karelsulcia muelleri]AGS33359.1 Dihydrolipoamide dehydrogenase of 2-oxoglutarate dehydrogenase [Candidatus Karelsulcia muelleri str. Sulcia-ALF]ALP70099.1 Dihydrolipoamide dehydrogenase of 2-oxoglutarate dehydrogenase [Candidatus Karelsulcia muelleri]